jgi:microcystin-dependent protein
VDPFLGEIRIFGGNFAPQGWAACDGALLPISQNEALYSLLGTTFGGDGQSTFGLPDFRGRMPVHVGNGIVYGEIAGSETVTVTQTQLPFHSHAVMAQSAAGSTPSPKGAFWAATGSTQEYSTTTPDTVMNAGTLQSTGSGKPHDNIMPYLTLMFIIALNGVFPPHQ